MKPRREGGNAVSTTMLATSDEASSPDASPLQRVKGRNHWILLDAAWAQRLGVRRSAGVYRIRSRELMLKLSQPGQHGTSGVPSVTSTGLPKTWPAGQKGAYEAEGWWTAVPELEHPRSGDAAA